MEWDMADFEAKEAVLASYAGIERPGVYIDGVFVALEDNTAKSEPSNPSTAKTPLALSFSSAVLNHALKDKKVPTSIWAPHGKQMVTDTRLKII
jgi:hypothetical protein